MRIAVSGTHATGKSTLVAELGTRLPGHRTMPEPYDILENRGHVFEYPPSVDDFVLQLRQSTTMLRRMSANTIFDRCPLDFLGYIHASPEAVRFDLERWREPIVAALRSLDLLIVLHVDRDHDPEMFIEDATYRLAVDGLLRDIVDGDAFDLCEGLEILTLSGDWDRRADVVMSRIETLRRQSAPWPEGTEHPARIT